MADKKSFWDSGFGSFVNNMLFGLPSLISGVIASSHLTGAEREQNAFNAQQSQLQRDFEAGQVEQQNAFNAEQSEINRQFQADMSNTAYQRSVVDMQRAGLNPALAYGNGGASTPSGAMATAGAAAGSAASGSGRGIPFTMSELMSALKMRKEMKLLEEQAKNVAADTKDKENSAALKGLQLEWNPQLFASEIGLRSDQSNKLKAEVESILATVEGQRIYNEYSPSLFQSQLNSAEVNRASMIAGIARMQAEIEHYAVQNEGIKADIGYKRALQVLTAAQTALTNKQTESVSADVWRKDFENAFQSRFGTLPNQPVWNNMAGLLGKFADLLNEGRSNFFDFVSGLFK